MASWGPGLYQDDVAEEIKSEYIKLLKSGKTNEDATNELITSFKELIKDNEDEPIFWFALADTQWNYGRLITFVKEKAIDNIRNGNNLKKWEEEGLAGESKKRKKVLSELEAKLNLQLPPLKKISTYTYYKCTWNIGDVFAYRLESDFAKVKGLFGNYIIIYKIDEDIWEKGLDGDVFPIVYLRVTKTPNLPHGLSDINNSDYIKSSPFNNGYRYINITKSKKALNKFIYIGNYKDINVPKYENIQKNIMFPIINFGLKDIEERIIKRI